MGTIRYCSQIKNLNHILAVSNQSIGQAVLVTGRHKSYSKDKGSCCREVSQTEGKTVVPWPRTSMWPCNIPEDPQPPNYDPYKIKSPDVVVPPLPPSSAKRTGFVFVTSGHQDQNYPGYQQNAHNQPPHTHSGLQQEGMGMDQEVEKDQEPKGFFTTLKELFGWKKKKSDRDSMIGNPEVRRDDEQKVDSVKSTDSLGGAKPSSPIKNWFQQSPIVHPDNWKGKAMNRMQRLENEVGQEVMPRLGYHGKNKYKYAFHEPWNPLDRLTLLAQAEKEEHPEVQQALPANANNKELT